MFLWLIFDIAIIAVFAFSIHRSVKNGMINASKSILSIILTVIIMTSNLGAKNILKPNQAKLGFGSTDTPDPDSENEIIKNKVMDEVKKAFKPEFLNRIDDISVFKRLDDEDIQKIAKLMLKTLEKRLSDNEITAEFSTSAIEKIAKEGFDPTYGARPLRRAIQNQLEDMLSEKIIDGEIKKGDNIIIEFTDNEYKVIAK